MHVTNVPLEPPSLTFKIFARFLPHSVSPRFTSALNSISVRSYNISDRLLANVRQFDKFGRPIPRLQLGKLYPTNSADEL